MLRTSGSTEFKTQLGEGGVGVGGDNKAERGRNGFDESEIDDGEVDSGEFGDDKIRKKA